jgi:hypothetical protein
MSRTAGIAALLLLCGGSALAQGMSAAPPGHPMASPCAADRAKYCKDVRPGGGRLIDCFESHRAQLAAACRTEMEPRFKMRDQMKANMTPGSKAPSKPPGPQNPG